MGKLLVRASPVDQTGACIELTGATDQVVGSGRCCASWRWMKMKQRKSFSSFIPGLSNSFHPALLN